GGGWREGGEGGGRGAEERGAHRPVPQRRARPPQDQVEDRASPKSREREDALPDRRRVEEAVAVDRTAGEPAQDRPQGLGAPESEKRRDRPDGQHRVQRPVGPRGLGGALEVVDEAEAPARSGRREEDGCPRRRIGAVPEPRQQPRGRKKEGEGNQPPRRRHAGQEGQSDAEEKDRQAI